MTADPIHTPPAPGPALVLPRVPAPSPAAAPSLAADSGPPIDGPFVPADARARIDRFHELYYYNKLWNHTQWLGVPTWKCPLDLWVYQEIIHETRPTIIIEAGTAFGGTALFFAGLFDLIGAGRVLTIDVEPRPGRPRHERVTYVEASSIDPAAVARIRRSIAPGERVMVVLDSLHRHDHVLAELRAYGPMVTPGCYLIAEDSNINGHPVQTDYPPDQGPGPFEAVRDYLRETDRFVLDRSREKLMMTFNPGGYLRCIGASESTTVVR